jgi:hypothetical protein
MLLWELKEKFMKTMEDMRLEMEQIEKRTQKELERLQEETLIAFIAFPVAMQQDLGVQGTCVELKELPWWFEQEFGNDNDGLFTIKIKKKTRKWFENLPEGDY